MHFISNHLSSLKRTSMERQSDKTQNCMRGECIEPCAAIQSPKKRISASTGCLKFTKNNNLRPSHFLVSRAPTFLTNCHIHYGNLKSSWVGAEPSTGARYLEKRVFVESQLGTKIANFQLYLSQTSTICISSRSLGPSQ